MEDLNEGISLQRAAQVRLDNIGHIRNMSQFINSPSRVDRMEQRFTLQQSMGRAEEMAALEAAEKLDEEKNKSQSDITSAIAMVKEGETEKRYVPQREIGRASLRHVLRPLWYWQLMVGSHLSFLDTLPSA